MMAETIGIEIIILMVIMFIVAPIIRIIDKALTKRWKQDLMDFEIARDVVAIYRKYNQEKTEKVSWIHQRFENFRNKIKSYFIKRKQEKSNKINYGI